jgi:Tfp pilus assembly protein PilN
MSITMGRPSEATGSAGTVAAFGPPQVNLLPPEVRAARSLGVLKRWLALTLVLVLLVLGLAYGWAHVSTQNAQAELTEAQAETTRLQAEEAKYAEVPRVLGAIDSTETARLLGMSSEIRWRPYLDAITTVLPGDVSISQFTLTGPALSSTSTDLVADPLQAPSIGTITFEGRSRTVPDTAAWIDALASVPGFSDPWVSTVAVGQEEGAPFYTVSTSVQLTDATLAHRFLDTEQEN